MTSPAVLPANLYVLLLLPTQQNILFVLLVQVPNLLNLPICHMVSATRVDGMHFVPRQGLSKVLHRQEEDRFG